MFLTTATRKAAQTLLPWLQQRLTSNQWLVDRQDITHGRCQGLRPRVLLSRSLCLYYVQDLARIPANRRQQALLQQVRLLSPFDKPGFYARWHGGTAQLWVWDHDALITRLPQAATVAVLPDSSLAEPQAQGQSWVAGIKGAEWQTWQQGLLQDSSWQAQPPADLTPQPLALQQAAPLQAADRQQLIHWGLSCVAALLVLCLLLQAGGALNLWQRQQQLNQELVVLNQTGKESFAARRQAQAAQAQWQARQQLQQPAQFVFIQDLVKVIPESANFWQRYQFEPQRLQLDLKDASPDPRDYVRRLGSISGLSNVQVQPDAGSDLLQLQADINLSLRQQTLAAEALSEDTALREPIALSQQDLVANPAPAEALP